MSRWPFRRSAAPSELGSDPDAEIEEELEFYLQLRTDELVAEGLTPEAARREAEARFGNPAQVAWQTRRERRDTLGMGRTTMMMGELRQDLRYAFRAFRRTPGFTVLAALTLAIAIAGNTAIFSVLDSAVLRALPFQDWDRLAFVNGYQLQDGAQAIRYASVPEFRDWQERSRTLTPMAAVDGNAVALSGNGPAERASAEVVSEGYFNLLGGEAAVGRTFTQEEFTVPDGYPVAVLSHALWERSFGSDPGAVGRTLLVNDRSVSVVGVMPADFVGVGLEVDLWLPLGMISLVGSSDLLNDRGSRFLPVIGRLAPGMSFDDAQAELDVIARELQAEYPRVNEDRFAQVEPFRAGYLGTTGRLLWILFGAGSLLLTIACANVANLLLVRAEARTRELTVRRAIGASGVRVARQLLVESIAMSVLGGVLGLGLSAWGLRALTPLIPLGVLPGYAHPSLSGRAFLFTLIVLAVVGVLAGLVPAVVSARRDLTASLRTGGRGVTGSRASAQRVFVVTQIGLALLLLVGAGLLARSFRAQLAIDPGLEMAGVQVFNIQPSRESLPDAERLRGFTAEVLRTVAAVPGVSTVAASSDFPLRGGASGAFIARPDDPQTRIRYHRHSVSQGYFETLGVELRAGRFIDSRDTETAPAVAVVTEAFVRRVFPEVGNGVGQRFWAGNPADPTNLAEIVGVVEDVRYRNLTQDMMEESNSPDVFFSIAQVPSRALEVAYRSSTDDEATASAVRRAVQELDPSLPVPVPTTLEELYRVQTATPRFAASLMGLFSSLALLLAFVGIYGVLSFSVSRRGPEIALRRALGAQAGEVARSVVWDGARLAALGLVAGSVAALLSGRLLESLLFNVRTTDPATFILVATAMMVVATLAALVPAWRASRQAPADVLRSE